MSYKKFEKGDILFNTIKTKPHYNFKIYSGKVVINNTSETSIYLQKLNEEVLPQPPEECSLDYSYDFSCIENSQYIATI